MVRKIEDLTGKQFGSLTVLERKGSDKDGRAVWLCRCGECGNLTEATGRALRTGLKKSCGCLVKKINSEMRKTHGETKAKLYGVWNNMKDRCYNKNSKSYHNYGARGIIVCEEWINSYENFSTWAKANGYEEGLSIDRINVNGNYEPSNCRWVTIKEQANNTRFNVYITYQGKTQTMKQWAQELGLNYWTVQARHLDHPKMTPEELFAGVREYNKFTYMGETLSLIEWSKKLDIPMGTLYCRLDRDRNISMEKLFERGDKRSAKLTYKGETKSISKWCKEFNLPYTKIKNRRYNHPEYTFEQLFGIEENKD